MPLSQKEILKVKKQNLLYVSKENNIINKKISELRLKINLMKKIF